MRRCVTPRVSSVKRPSIKPRQSPRVETRTSTQLLARQPVRRRYSTAPEMADIVSMTYPQSRLPTTRYPVPEIIADYIAYEEGDCSGTVSQAFIRNRLNTYLEKHVFRAVLWNSVFVYSFHNFSSQILPKLTVIQSLGEFDPSIFAGLATPTMIFTGYMTLNHLLSFYSTLMAKRAFQKSTSDKA